MPQRVWLTKFDGFRLCQGDAIGAGAPTKSSTRIPTGRRTFRYRTAFLSHFSAFVLYSPIGECNGVSFRVTGRHVLLE